MNNQFLYNTKAEFLKTRGTAVIWLTLLAAAFLPFINSVILLERADVFIPKLRSAPWHSILNMNWKNGASIILPFFVILINNGIAQIEYRNNTWKQVYASPRRYADIFFSKFLVTQEYLAVFLVLFNLFVILSGYAVGFLQNGYPFSSQPIPWSLLLTISGRIYLGILGVSAIQYWLSIRYRNFMVPLGIGIGLWITGIVLMDWDKIVYYPYMYSTLLYFIDTPRHTGTLSALTVNAAVCFVLALSWGFWNICTMKEKG